MSRSDFVHESESAKAPPPPIPGHRIDQARFPKGSKLAQNRDRTGELSSRRQTNTVCTRGRPEGSGRKVRPGLRTSSSVAMVGAIPNPAEISHILVWMSLAYWTGRGLAPALAHSPRKAS